jgi:hypothetical protein
VYTLPELDPLLMLVPTYLHERRFGEWRRVPGEVPHGLDSTARWFAVVAGL